MAEKNVKQRKNCNTVYFTQGELAERWRVTEATIKNIRETGGISYFTPPNSSRVLYPKSDVIRAEREHLIVNKKEIRKREKPSVTKREKPVNSKNSSTEWRI